MRLKIYILLIIFLCFSDLESQTTITLTNVYDAFGKDIAGLNQDFGFSCVVQYNGKMILFDSGTDARKFERNLKALKIDLSKVDIAIVSHGHYDHIGGFDYLFSVNPKVKIYLPNDFTSLGAPTKFPFREKETELTKGLSKDELYFHGDQGVNDLMTVPTGRFWKADFEYVTKAKEVLPGLTLIPTTSALMGTFSKYPPNEEKPRLMGMPELSAAFSTEKGQVILSGCSHSSIDTIIAASKKLSGSEIHMVAGGFHLIPYDTAYIESLAKRMLDQHDIEHVAPAHCSGQPAFAIFKKVYGKKYKFFGLGESITLK